MLRKRAPASGATATTDPENLGIRGGTWVVRSTGGMRLAALASEHRKGMIKSGDIENAIKMGSRQHFINEGTWIHQLQMDRIALGPAVQRNQQGQSAGIHCFNACEVEQNRMR